MTIKNIMRYQDNIKLTWEDSWLAAVVVVSVVSVALVFVS